jgi:hypothetical protein
MDRRSMKRGSYLRALGLIVGAIVVYLCVELGPDLFYTIPWSFRKAVCWVGVAAFALVLLKRLVRTRPTDIQPHFDVTSNRLAGWLGLVVAGLAVLLAVPLLRHPDYLALGDWDLFLGKLEAARRTIVLWGQFPWWDPWTRGGFPLAANPQCGVSGIGMPLALLFGTSVGLRLATIICFVLAAEGARRLARIWLGDPVASAAVGLIYAIHGGVLVAAVAAYHLSMCYPALPWMLYYVFRLERRPADGLWLGAWAAFNVLNGIQYFTVYIVLIVGVVWLRRLFTTTDHRAFLVGTVLAAGMFLLLSGWRVATTGLVYRDFPRRYASPFSETPWSILLHALNRPSPATLAVMGQIHFWENTCYIGPIVLVLAALSLFRGWRWWHTLTAGCAWLAMGSIEWYHPSYWLAHFPVFATMHVVTRWRFMAMLGVALSAGSTIAFWRSSERRALRRLALAAVGLIALDYTVYGFEVLPLAFALPPTEDRFPGPDLGNGPIIQVVKGQGFPSILRGYGVIHGFEPLMGYHREAFSARTWRGRDDYVGEYWTARGPVRPEFWSPNRIVLRVEPYETVFINQNPGSWWRINGQPKFARFRCAEKEKPFAAEADAEGRLVLEIHPRGLELGAALHAVGFVMIAATLAWLRWLPLRSNAD